MNINQNSWIITIAYFFTLDWDIPKRTSLCTLFWRVVGSVVMMLTISMLVGFCLGGIGAIIWSFLLEALSLFTAIVICGAVFILCLRVVENIESRDPQTLAGKYFRAVKDKVCPIINIIREREQP